MKVNKPVAIVSKDIVLNSVIDRIAKDLCSPLFFRDLKSALDFIYNCSPDLLVMDLSAQDDVEVRILNDIKSDPIFGKMAVLTIFPDYAVIPDWNDLMADDFIRRSMVESEIGSRIELSLLRAERIVEINPLTRLPGNITITRQIQARLDAGDKFGVGYADIDFFKPFNDRYGFGRGDEVLKMIGRLILNMVKESQPQGSFVGHVGGDDFVYIMDIDTIESASQKIIEYFDKMVVTFYDPADRDNGCIQSVDREGKTRSFPFMTISIGVTHNEFRNFAHYSEISTVASEMKHCSKKVTGSCLMVDRRKV